MKFECVTVAELKNKQWTVDGPVMVMPFTDPALANQAGVLAAQRAASHGLLLGVHDVNREGFVTCVNKAFAATRSPWLGYMAQDAFAGRDWMALALQTLHQQRGVLLAFNDGKWHGALASFGLASREWAVGNYPEATFFCADYLRHYADTELSVLARQAGGYVYQAHSVLVEVDWGKDRAPVHAPDRSLFKQRMAQGFGGKVTDPALLALFG